MGGRPCAAAIKLAKCLDEQGVALGFEVGSHGLELGRAHSVPRNCPPSQDRTRGHGLYVFSKDICV